MTSMPLAHHASSRKQQQEPSSPWRKLLIRSRSLEGESSDENSDSNHNKKKKSSRRQRPEKTHSKGGASSWGWFLTPPTRLVGNPLHRTNPPTSKRHLFSASNLTMFLLRLDDNISQYCLLLSDPSIEHCQQAANILDSSIAAASSPHSSPASNGSSPSVSPTSFFRKSADEALEGEWDTYSAPFLLMTGAEALYAEMDSRDEMRSHLYNTIQTDLRIVKERLCDPWLARSEQQHPQSVNSTGSTAHQAATSMALVFENLQSVLNIKRKLVDMQARLFSESSEPFCVKATTLLEMCRAMLPEIPREESAVTPMFSSLVKEIKAWIALLEIASHLEQCQFTDSILSARKLKMNLVPTPNTVLQSWFSHMLESFMSIMPIYFDRINAFASPLYGFDTMHMWADSKERSEHYDSLVLDFLRKHESKGGPSMAVGIVIDAVNTHNENFARGFVVPSESMSTAQQLTTAERQRKEWQAVYMRSTVVHYNSASSPMSRSPSHGGGSISTIMRRSKGSSFRKGSRNTISGEDDFTRSLANIIRPSSQDASSAAHHQSQVSVMEYPSESGPVSWPYTEWSLLVDLVKEDLSPTLDDGVQAVTYRQPESPKVVAKKPTSVAFGLPPPAPVTPPPPLKAKTDSSFHLVRLSEYISMVVIVKCEDDGKWHLRRTRGHTDEEIRVFLNEMALKLKVSVLFDKDSVENVKTVFRSKDSQTLENDLVSAWQQWDESNTQELLRELKKSFQLRPQSPYMDSLRKRFGKRSRTSARNRNKKQRDIVDYSESAMAFFLGSDLQL